MPRQPNILLIMTDEQKATAISLYGNEAVRTPSLEGLADRGVVFDQAFTPHPLCVPARVAFWTGRYPHGNGSRTNEVLLQPGQPHFARVLHDAGYTMGIVGKNHCFLRDDLDLFQTVTSPSPREPTRMLSDPRCRQAAEFLGQARLWHSPVGAPTAPYPADVSTTHLIADEAISFIRQFRDQSLALWVSFPDPHPPFQVPEPYAGLFPPSAIPLPLWRVGELENKPERQKVFFELMGLTGFPAEAVQRVIGIYYAMIVQIDAAVGRILATLDELGLREDTIIVFCSDHGDLMGEHAMLEKGGMLYDALVRVPLIVSWPGHLPEGQRDPNLVSLIDVMPTVLQLLGRPVPAWAGGRVLPTLGGQPRNAVFAEYGAGGPPVTLADLQAHPPGPHRRRIQSFLRQREAEGRPKMIRTQRWKYVHDPFDPVDELYDLESDPGELTNLADRPEYREIKQELRLALLDWSIETEDSLPVPLYF